MQLIDSIPAPESPTWQEELARAITSNGDLLDALGLAGSGIPVSADAARDFPVRVPRPFLARMRPGDPEDPLLKQVLASAEETRWVPGFGPDPVGEQALKGPDGLIRKYAGRALLVLAGSCAINCRYCFRRHFPYGEHRLGPDQRRQILAALAGDDSISEVILSGGDPLMLPDDRLDQWACELAAIDSIRTLRVHTRLPVVIPSRVTAGLVRALTRHRLRCVFVIHANHANELDAALTRSLQRLREAGVTLLNQSVLLRGVNDSVQALADLSEALFAAGVMPYYLHLLDPVAGAGHFDVPEQEARRLLGQVARRMPGYLVPRLVREEPGAGSKRERAPLY